MSITYPLSMPSGAQRINISMVFVAAASRSEFTNSVQVQRYEGDSWALEFVLPEKAEADLRAWLAFLGCLRGITGTFLAGDPVMRLPKGVATGTPLVKGAAQTGETLLTDGWMPSTTNVLKGGDYIQIGNRLYMNLVNVSSDGSGDATLDIFPRLRESPADNATIITTDCKGLFRLASNAQTWALDERMVYSTSFSAVEAI